MRMLRHIHISEVEEFVGQELGRSDWHLVSQVEINAFADLTGDHQWVHVDVDRARIELGETIAHGYLTLSLIPMLTAQITKIDGVGHGLNYGLDKVRFLAPVPAGSRVRGKQTLLSVEMKGAGTLTVRNRNRAGRRWKTRMRSSNSRTDLPQQGHALTV